jgi:membrane-associated PAP2 superfamily phosphatase
VLSTHPEAPVERGAGAWLRTHRVRFALWIAAAEGIVVAVSHDVTKWTVLALAAVSVLVWSFAHRKGPALVRQVLWLLAASQLLALLLVALAVIVKWAVILGLVAFAVLGLAFLLFDRR